MQKQNVAGLKGLGGRVLRGVLHTGKTWSCGLDPGQPHSRMQPNVEDRSIQGMYQGLTPLAST